MKGRREVSKAVAVACVPLWGIGIVAFIGSFFPALTVEKAYVHHDAMKGLLIWIWCLGSAINVLLITIGGRFRYSAAKHEMGRVDQLVAAVIFIVFAGCALSKPESVRQGNSGWESRSRFGRWKPIEQEAAKVHLFRWIRWDAGWCVLFAGAAILNGRENLRSLAAESAQKPDSIERGQSA